MGRWRPPAEKGTALITREGHDRLKAEVDELWRLQRPEVVNATVLKFFASMGY